MVSAGGSRQASNDGVTGRLRASIASVIRGKDEVIDLTLVALLARGDRKSTRLNSSHIQKSRMPSSA